MPGDARGGAIMGCVYMVTNKETLDQYVGFTSKNIELRRTQHIYFARHGKPGHFPSALRKYIPDIFRWEVLLMSDDIELLKKKEVEFISKYHPAYNMTIGGEGIVGMPCSEETKRKLSAIFKGKPLSEETKRKLSEVRLGKKQGPHSEETKRKISEAHTGKKREEFSAEWRQHLSEANTGKKRAPRSEEWRRKSSESHIGKPLSEETRRKMSEARRGKKRGPYGPNGPMSEEQKRNISAGLIKFNTAKKLEMPS